MNRRPEENAAITKVSVLAGLRAAAVAGVGAYAGLRYLEAYSKTFQSFRLGASGRTATVFIPIAFTFTLFSEQKVLEQANPAWFAKEKENRHTALGIHKRVANWIYGHPFPSVLIAAVPGYVGFFWATRDMKHLALSQRVIHTRVMGQAYVLAVLVGLMGLNSYMDGRGGAFVEGE